PAGLAGLDARGRPLLGRVAGQPRRIFLAASGAADARERRLMPAERAAKEAGGAVRFWKLPADGQERWIAAEAAGTVGAIRPQPAAAPRRQATTAPALPPALRA